MKEQNRETVREMPCVNPAPTKTWSELIRCPECKTDEWAMVEQEYEMPFAFYRHTCQHCGHVILESEWNNVGKSDDQPEGYQAELCTRCGEYPLIVGTGGKYFARPRRGSDCKNYMGSICNTELCETPSTAVSAWEVLTGVAPDSGQPESADAERKPGRTRLVYDKAKRAIVAVTNGELTRQALDEGYQAVEVALGPDGVRALVEERNTAQGRVKELEEELAQWEESQASVERAQQRRDIEVMKSVRLPLEARIAELQAQLAEAKKRNQRLEILGAQFAGRLAAESMEELAAAAGRAVDIQGRIEGLEAKLADTTRFADMFARKWKSICDERDGLYVRVAELKAQLANETKCFRAAVDEGKRFEAQLAVANAKQSMLQSASYETFPDDNGEGGKMWRTVALEAEARAATLRGVLEQVQ